MAACAPFATQTSTTFGLSVSFRSDDCQTPYPRPAGRSMHQVTTEAATPQAVRPPDCCNSPIRDPVTHWIDEIKSLRTENDWRLRIIYMGPTYYVSALLITSGLAVKLFASANLRENYTLTFVALMFSLANALYVGVLTGNHYIEKKIELYILSIEKKIFSYTGEAYFYWISFQYGENFDRTRIANIIATMTHASILIFQYIIPLVIATAVLIMAIFLKQNFLTLVLYYFIIAVVFFCFIGTIHLLAFVLTVKKEHIKFYKKINAAT
jgi:hypothetical protein